MLEEKILELYIELDSYFQKGWIPTVSKDWKVFSVFSPTKMVYTSIPGEENNPLEKTGEMEYEEFQAKHYLKTLIKYKDLVQFLPRDSYLISIEHSIFGDKYKLIRTRDKDIN